MSVEQTYFRAACTRFKSDVSRRQENLGLLSRMWPHFASDKQSRILGLGMLAEKMVAGDRSNQCVKWRPSQRMVYIKVTTPHTPPYFGHTPPETSHTQLNLIG